VLRWFAGGLVAAALGILPHDGRIVAAVSMMARMTVSLVAYAGYVGPWLPPWLASIPPEEQSCP